MDLFSQAEHDEDAQAILLCPDEDFIKEVEMSISDGPAIMSMPTCPKTCLLAVAT